MHKIKLIRNCEDGALETFHYIIGDNKPVKLEIGGVAGRALTRKLLSYLCRRKGLMFNRNIIMSVVWRDIIVTPRSVDQHVSYLRTKVFNVAVEKFREINDIPKVPDWKSQEYKNMSIEEKKHVDKYRNTVNPIIFCDSCYGLNMEMFEVEFRGSENTENYQPESNIDYKKSDIVGQIFLRNGQRYTVQKTGVTMKKMNDFIVVSDEKSNWEVIREADFKANFIKI